jgi:hypothetical protein
MELTRKISKELNLDKALQKLVFKEIAIPYHDDYNSVDSYWYPHPPCIVPLFIGYGASYKGIINHFFINRKNTFIEYNLEYGSIVEKAMNFKQFSIYLLLPMIMSNEGINDEIIEFANQIEFKEYKELDEFSIRHGDNTDFFNDLVYFKDNLPLDIVKDVSKYKGDFPTSGNNINKLQIVNSCSFEISPAAYEIIKNSKELPKWLDKETEKIKLFENYISSDQLKEAWLTLNSRGWLLTDVVKCLEILKSKTNDKLFSLVADNWIGGWKSSKSKKSDRY